MPYRGMPIRRGRGRAMIMPDFDTIPDLAEQLLAKEDENLVRGGIRGSYRGMRGMDRGRCRGLYRCRGFPERGGYRGGRGERGGFRGSLGEIGAMRGRIRGDMGRGMRGGIGLRDVPAYDIYQ